ncbi:PQQ-binding-like beta-propeller repeat protein [bacterium]|nr:PQQ-binding-like beta-propeller repeat protein [bacterium]
MNAKKIAVGLFCMVFFRTGFRLAAGSIILNDNTGTSHQTSVALDMNQYGRVVFVWSDGRNSNGDIYGQLFSSKGRMVKTNFRAHDAASDATQINPDVAMNERGHFVVVWEDNRDGDIDIYARLFEAQGNPKGPAFRVNDDASTSYQHMPAVDMDRAGRFTVCWMDTREGGTPQIYMQLYNADGSPYGENTMAHPYDLGSYHLFPCIGMNRSGRFVITWLDSAGTGFFNVFARRFDAGGSPEGNVLPVSQHYLQDQDIYERAPVAVQENGDFLIYWSFGYAGAGSQIYGALYDAQGSVKQGQFQFPPSGAAVNQASPDVCTRPDGGYQVVWNQPGAALDIYTRPLNASCVPLGPSTAMSTESRDQIRPRVCVDPYETVISAWEDYRNTHGDIYAARLGECMPIHVTAGSYPDRVSLLWDPNYGDTENRVYNIYRFDHIGDMPSLVTSINTAGRNYPALMHDWIDTNVVKGSSYYYQVESTSDESTRRSQAVIAQTPVRDPFVRSSWTAQTPVIDGQVLTEEWAGATQIIISDSSAVYPVVLYVMNNGTHLFLAATDPNDAAINPANTFGFLFDADNDDQWDEGAQPDGRFDILNAGAAFTAMRGDYPDIRPASPVPANGVVSDIAVAGGYVQYETAIDLTAGHLRAQAGETIGASLWVADPGSVYPTYYGNAGEWPSGALWSAAETLGDLILAAEPDTGSTIGDLDWPQYRRDARQRAWAEGEDALFPPFDYISFMPLLMPLFVSSVGQQFYVAHIDTNEGEPFSVLAFNYGDNQAIWEFEVPGTDGHEGTILPIAMNERTLLVNCMFEAEGIHAVDRATGTLLWTKPVVEFIPVIDGDRGYVMGDSLICFDLGTGATLWNSDLSDGTVPAVDETQCYAIAGGELYAFDKESGDLYWQLPSSGSESVSVDDDYVYSSNNDSLMARDKSDGSVIWQTAFPEGYNLGVFYTTTMAVSDERIVLPLWSHLEERLMLLSVDKSNGVISWSKTWADLGGQTPVIANGVVYMVLFERGGDYAALWGLSEASGDSLFFNDSYHYLSGPVVANHTLIASAYEGLVMFSNLPVAVEEKAILSGPAQFTLHPNFPNPFNPSTTLSFDLPVSGPVRLILYDVLGKNQQILADRVFPAGRHAVQVQAGHLPSGVYLYRIEAGSFRAIRKCLLIK